jgi:ClpP class serine protease
MKEKYYAIEADYLRKWLQDRDISMEDRKAASELALSITIHAAGSPRAVDEIYSSEGGTAHIRIEGPMSPEGPDFIDVLFGYNGVSYKTLVSAIERARDDPLIKNVSFAVNTPGGTVDGADYVWQAHESLKRTKTTEARVTGTMASAGYWIMSNAGKILATSPVNEIGSIGVIATAYDYSKMLENHGVKEIKIVSSNAPDKRPDLLTEEGRDVLLREINAIENVFYQRISQGRSVSHEHIQEHFGKGGLLIASEAEAAGMIDGLLVTGRFSTDHDRPISAITPQSNSPSGKTIPPARAGTTQEGHMNLSELLAANPAAAAETEALKAKAKAEGRDEALAEQSARVSRVMGVITSEAYPANIKALAGDVISGKKGIDAFDAAVTVYDAEAERKKSEAAQAETAATGALGADKPSGKSADELAMEAAGNAAIERAKAQREEVKKWL